jgi:hypothetical protein
MVAAFRYLQLYVKCIKILGRCPLQRTVERTFGSAGGLDILYNIGILHIQTRSIGAVLSSFA